MAGISFLNQIHLYLYLILISICVILLFIESDQKFRIVKLFIFEVSKSFEIKTKMMIYTLYFSFRKKSDVNLF